MLTNISLNQFRACLKVVIGRDGMSLGDLLTGKNLTLDLDSFLQQILDKEADKELIKILAPHFDFDADNAFDGLEYIADFFAFIKANWTRVLSWLTALGLAAKIPPVMNTGLNDLK